MTTLERGGNECDIAIGRFQSTKTGVLLTNVDLVNDIEHTKFGLILSIGSQEKTNSDINQGP